MKPTEHGALSNSSIRFYSPSPITENLYFYLISSGHYFCDENYLIVRENFDSFLIAHISEGELHITVEDKTYIAQKDDTVIINCLDPHIYYSVNSCEFLWIHINGSNSSEICDSIIKSRGNVIKCTNSEYIKKLITRLDDFGNDSEINNSLDIYKLLLNLQSSQGANAHLSENLADIIINAKKYITEHIGEKLTVEDIALHLHLSPSHFSRVFKKQVGFSPYDYVLITRLNQAKAYLHQTSLSITEIAFKLGFGSDTSFTTFFKKHTGLPPNKFRNLMF